MIQSYYSVLPVRSYFGGSSEGGRSAMVEAARYPNDFDAITAGQPAAMNFGKFTASAIRTAQAQFPGGPLCTGATTLAACLSSQVIPTSGPNNLLPFIAAATLSKCDAEDGLTDGIIADPTTCDFDPMIDLPTCAGGPGPSCLTLAQKNVLKTLYTDTTFASVGDVFPRYLPGYETDPGISMFTVASNILGAVTPPTARPSQYGGLAEDISRYLVYNNPAFFIQGYDLNTNVPYLVNDWTTPSPGPNSKFSQSLSYDVANDTNLSAFKAKGGKLLLIQGYADSLVAPENIINTYNLIMNNIGNLNDTRSFARLFMLPGLSHGTTPSVCANGVPCQVDFVGGLNTGFMKALEQWDKTGVAPDSLLGTDKTLTVTRPLCAYPFKAVYTGPAGDTAAMKVASNFACRFYDLKGLFNPVDNLPALNEVKAGQAIPVKFSLGGNWGLNIMANGYPKSEVIACDAMVSVNGVDETVNAGGSSLQYDPTNDQYSYIWKTDKNWKNSCRQLVVRLNEGTVVRANFTFK